MHGCHPFGNAKARAVVWNFPDPIPQHREPLYGTRPDLMAKYPTHEDKRPSGVCPPCTRAVQDKNLADGLDKKFPADPSPRVAWSSTKVGAEETRSNPWLAELQQESFVEINPKAAPSVAFATASRVWVVTPTGAA